MQKVYSSGFFVVSNVLIAPTCMIVSFSLNYGNLPEWEIIGLKLGLTFGGPFFILLFFCFVAKIYYYSKEMESCFEGNNGISFNRVSPS